MISALVSIAIVLLTFTVAAETTTPQSHKYIYHSHVFHTNPQNVIDSILFDARVAVDGSSHTVLDIDASSSRLDDGAVSSLVDRLATILDEESDEKDHGETEVSSVLKRRVMIKLALGMNQLTPSGASKLFYRLANVENRGAAGNKTSSDDVNNSSSSNQGDDPTAAEDKTMDVNETTTATSDENATSTNTTLKFDTEVTKQDDILDPNIELEELDLSFNDIGGHGANPANLDILNSLRSLFERGLKCHTSKSLLVPRALTMENCGIGPAFCRSIGRGILNAFEAQKQSKYRYRPSVLRIGGNQAIGDPGVVALAAALRLAVHNTESDAAADESNTPHCVLEELDLSSCNVGDAGAEAVALALACNPYCISKLDLSNNQISDVGANAIGRALVESHRLKFVQGDSSSFVLDEIVLDNNFKIGDDGAASIADALSCGAVRCISLRSCSIKAGGSAAFGKALLSLAKRKGLSHEDPIQFSIDLSGNSLGIKPAKKKKGVREKASSHISSLGKSLQKGWKEGLKGASVSIGLTAESDDDEENLSVMGGLIEPEDEGKKELLVAAAARCGARSFAAEILNIKTDEGLQNDLCISVAMRRCSLDDCAVDALSAAVTEIKKCSGTRLVLDVSMNSADYRSIAALLGDKKEEKLLSSMAKRHMTALSVLNEARERAALAAEASAERQFGGFLSDEEDDLDSDQYDDY